MTEQTQTMLDIALSYLQRGISILPVDGKRPAMHKKPDGKLVPWSWKQLQKTVPAERTVSNWYNLGEMPGIGVICGTVSGNLVVIDLDGLDAVHSFEQAFPHLLDTYTVRTGSGKGKHLYFYVEDMPPNTIVKGFEVRGDGCYVVAPPSIHPDTGMPYAVERDQEISKLPNLNEVVEWINARKASPSINPAQTQQLTRLNDPNTSPTPNERKQAYLDAAVNAELDRVRGAVKGVRNTTLNTSAFALGQLVAGGELSMGAIEQQLIDAARAAGLPEVESRRTISSAMKAAAKEPRTVPEQNGRHHQNGHQRLDEFIGDDQDQTLPENNWKPDDDEIAIELAQHWKQKVAFFHSDWHVYENGCWTRRATQEVKRNIRIFLRQFRSRGIAVTSRIINSLCNLAEDDTYIPDRHLMDATAEQKRYINLRNGMFNLETFELEPHNPDLYFTTQLDFDYDPDADCPTLRRYLNSSLVTPSGETDQQMIMLVQEALAYSMTARTDMKASFWLVGKPDSGKSTMISFLRALMGNLHATVDLNQLGSNRFLLSGIVGKRVVTFTEASANSVLPDALYKAMVGGTDEIYADVKNKPGIAFVPTAKFWWAMNDAPRFTDRSGATLNRLHTILFNRTIPQSERITGLDTMLARERSGVFNWLIFGYKRLIRAGAFTVPEQSTQWKEDYRRENDTELSFITDTCVTGNDRRVQSQELYDAYRQWCDRNGFRAKNINQAAREWQRLNFQRTRIQGVTYWYGVSISDS